MATAPDLMIEEEEVQPPEGLTLADILQPGINLAEFLDESKLTDIGQKVTRDVELDEGSRGDWLDRYERALEVAMQVKKAKNFPWPKAANVKYPLLTIAAIQFQARAYPAIVDGSNLVKGRVLGPDPDGQKRARADRIAQHMTWQLLYRMPGWEEETDKLLLMLPIVGCVFRKTWFDSIENANRSEMVSGKDFVIDYWAKNIECAPRFTQILHYYPHEVREMVAAGLWLDVPVQGDKTGEDKDAIVDFYEQHRCLDLDEDGYPEHYVVTTTKEGKVARIVPCFGPEDVKVATALGVLPLVEVLQAGRLDIIGGVVKINRRQYFTKYGFIPAPDGSFYDIGFGTLLDDITETIDTSLNQMLDAGALQNAQGGFVGSGVQVRGGTMRFTLGEWKRVDTTGGPLRDNILPLTTNGPSPVLFNLLQMLIQAAKEITSVQDVMTGEGTTNQPATTTLALIEQGHKVMSAIFKRIHRAFGQELRILRRLNRDYLDEEEYFQLHDEQEAVQVGRADYADEDLDVIPVSDPNQVSDMQKIARASALFEMFNGDPLINQMKLRQNMLEGVGVRDVPAYFDVPKPMPDPKIAMDAEKSAAMARQADATAAERLSGAAERLNNMGLLEDAAVVAEAARALAEEGNAAPDGQGGVPGVVGEPGDAGVPGLSGEAPLGPDGGMGGWPDGLPSPGDPGAGSPAGPVAEAPM